MESMYQFIDSNKVVFNLVAFVILTLTFHINLKFIYLNIEKKLKGRNNILTSLVVCNLFILMTSLIHTFILICLGLKEFNFMYIFFIVIYSFSWINAMLILEDDILELKVSHSSVRGSIGSVNFAMKRFNSSVSFFSSFNIFSTILAAGYFFNS